MIFDNSETNVLSTEFQLKQKKDWEEEAAKKELLYATKYKDLPDTEKKPKWVKYINAEGKLTHSEFDDGYVKYLAFRNNPASNYDECLSDLTTHFSQDTLQAFQIPLEGKGPLPPIDHTCGTREEMLAKWHEDQKTWVQYQDAAPEIKRLAQDFFDRHLSEWRTKAARANLTIQTEFGTFPYWSEGHYNLPKDAKGIYQPMHYLTLTKVA